MQLQTFLASLFAATVIAHGVIVNPPSRKLGPGMTKLCGQAAFDIARGDVTASLETVAPNITAGCESELPCCLNRKWECSTHASITTQVR